MFVFLTASLSVSSIKPTNPPALIFPALSPITATFTSPVALMLALLIVPSLTGNP